MDNPPSRHRKARAAGRTVPLRRDEILDCVRQLAATEGVDAVTMRRVAERLGVTGMALYAHVSGKDDLVDEIIGVRLEQDGLPDAALRWDEWMIEACERLRLLLVAEPVILDRYLRRPVGVPAALHRMDAALASMLAGGLSDEAAVEAFGATHAFTIGFAALQQTRAAQRSPAGHTTLDASQPGFWPAYLGTEAGAAYPTLHRLRPDLAAIALPTRFRGDIARLLHAIAGHDGSPPDRPGGGSAA